MKITGGKFRSRNIKTPKGTVTRPTSAMLREVIFNILSNDTHDAAFLDIFAGSGSVGLEALSRGASHASFVENNKAAASIIKENLAIFDIAHDAVVLPTTARAAIEKFKREGTIFDIIFLDPPFSDLAAYTDTLNLLSDILSPNGTIIAQHDKRAELSDSYLKIEKVRIKNIGDNSLSFYKSAP